MTIGIAAHGPNAAAAILNALASAERVATGAIGGFVSLAAIGTDALLRRTEIQRGGGAALLAGGLAPEILASPVAALMSSGPDRPTPLAQFTPGDARVGLVTGHRFPNMPGAAGSPLNDDVLARMAAGAAPDAAVAAVLAANPSSDAGLIAIGRDGAIGLGNTAYLEGFPDLGRSLMRSAADPAVAVAVLHNAIAPHASLAALVAELALGAMDGVLAADGALSIEAGIPVRTAPTCTLHVDAGSRAVGIDLVVATAVPFRLSAGYGPGAPVRRDGTVIGFACEEPYLVVENGRLVSINGASSATVGLRHGLPSGSGIRSPQFEPSDRTEPGGGAASKGSA